MRTMSRLLFGILGLTLMVCQLYAQWVTTQPPFRGASNALVAIDTIVYAGTDGMGVKYSENRGVNWQTVAVEITNGYVTALARGDNGVGDTSLFIGTPTGVSRYDPRIFKWVDLSAGLSNSNVRSMLMAGDSLYVGTHGGVFFSPSHGSSWSLVNNGMTDSIVTALGWQDDGAGTTVLLAGTPNGVYGSLNGGQDWSAANTGLTSTDVRALLVRDSIAFAGTTGGIFRATSDSLHWVPAIGGLTNLDVRAFAIDSAYLLAATAGGVFRSTDNGMSWSAINNGLGSSDVRALLVHRGRLFAATENGVYHSANHGGSWTRFVSGMGDGFCFGLTTMPKPGGGTYLFAGLSLGGVFRSSDNGTTWTTCNVGIRNISVQGLGVLTKPGNVKILWAGTQKGLYLSTDFGDSWTSAGADLDNRQIRSAVYQGSTFIAGSSAGPYRSTDDGASWSLSTSGLSANYIMDLLVNGSTLLAGTTAAVNVSTDAGASWTPSGNGITVGNIFRLIAVPSASAGTDLYAGSGGAGAFKSTNGGASWTQVANGLTNPNVLSLASSGTTVFAGQYFTGFAYTTNGGANWSASNAGLPDLNVRCLHVDGATIYAGMDRGIAYRPISQIVTDVGEGGAGTPQEVALHQNYPNPFNPSTVIRYDLPVAAHVTLSVHDVLGRSVAGLVHGVEAAGQHAVEWHASAVSSGVYYIRLQAGGRSLLRKMLLMK